MLGFCYVRVQKAWDGLSVNNASLQSTADSFDCGFVTFVFILGLVILGMACGKLIRDQERDVPASRPLQLRSKLQPLVS